MKRRNLSYRIAQPSILAVVGLCLALTSIGCATSSGTNEPRLRAVGIKTIHNRSAACPHFSARVQVDSSAAGVHGH